MNEEQKRQAADHAEQEIMKREVKKTFVFMIVTLIALAGLHFVM